MRDPYLFTKSNEQTNVHELERKLAFYEDKINNLERSNLFLENQYKIVVADNNYLKDTLGTKNRQLSDKDIEIKALEAKINFLENNIASKINSPRDTFHAGLILKRSFNTRAVPYSQV